MNTTDVSRCKFGITVMDNAVGCFAYGNIFSCMAFKLYLGSSDDILWISPRVYQNLSVSDRPIRYDLVV